MPDSSNGPSVMSIADHNSNPDQDSETCKDVLVELGDVTAHNIKLLKKINMVVFPIAYHDIFYKDVLNAGELAKLAYYNDVVVGAVCCRTDTAISPSTGEPTRKLYIMTLGCLARYRRLGIGTKMVRHVLEVAENDGNYDSIYLHVQINNEEAINLYRKFEFDIVETKQNYYKRIEPADAYVLEKKLVKTGKTSGKEN